MDRRHVLKTGAKLAYAAPLIVASAKLVERGAAASVPCFPPCGPCEVCSDVLGICVPIDGCTP